MKLKPQYAWLALEPGPRVLVEALKLYGVRETVGPVHNPVIMGWARELGLENYQADETAWCGLFAAIVAKRAGFDPVRDPLWAANWLRFGTPSPTPALGDVLVFRRPGGNHVGLYVGEDDEAFHVLGGNQGNAVSIIRKSKEEFRGARRCPWRIAQPANVRPIRLAADGVLSTNEA